jgi:hypothetical protein
MRRRKRGGIMLENPIPLAPLKVRGKNQEKKGEEMWALYHSAVFIFFACKKGPHGIS